MRRRAPVHLVTSFALVALAAACNGGGGAGPLDQATAEETCTAVCDREVECNPAEDHALCMEDCTEAVGVIREDVFVAVNDCAIALECTASGEECATCAPTSTHTTYETRCRDGLGECDLAADDIDSVCEVNYTPGNDETDAGGFMCLLATNHIATLTACFDEPDCPSRISCLQAAYEQIGLF